jgi:hypothetical protein
VGIDFECDRCRSVHFVHDGPVAWYTLPDGREFFGSHATGWCSLCGVLTEVEELRSPDYIDWLMESLDDEAFPGLRDHLAIVREWSVLRRLPPHCLRCGDTGITALKRFENILAMPDDAEPFRHPECGGAFHVKHVYFDQPVVRCLTVDGKRTDRAWGQRTTWALGMARKMLRG